MEYRAISCSAALDLLSTVAPFRTLGAMEQADLAPRLKPLALRPGARLHGFDELPPGILILVEGQLRLLGQDERGEAFTLARLDPGTIGGWLALARCCLHLWRAAAGFCRPKPS